MKKLPFLFVLCGLVILACTLTQAQISHSPSRTTPTGTALKTGPPSPTLTATPTQAGGCKVTAQALHLRAGPGIGAPVLKYLHAGDVLKALPAPPAGVWLAVQTTTGQSGYVNSTFTDCNKRNP